MALTWLKGMISRLSLNGSKLSRGSEDMDSADLIMDISNALVASVTEESWPDEGSRSASISVSLASRCDVGKELLVLREEGESQYVTLCCVPGRVPTLGLKTLDAWAARVATGLDPSAWLPGFLLDNSNNLMAAVRAADFLGCRLFQELMLEVQLLRVALGRNTEQTEADNQHVPLGSWSIPALSSLSKAAFQQLPCVRQQPESAPLPTGGEPSNSTANDCSQGELAISAVEEVQAGDGSGSASSDDEGAVGGSTIGSVPKQASVEEEWDELYGPVQPLDPAQVWGRGGQQLGPNADEEGLRGGEQEPQQQVHVPVRHVTPVQMEILVEALANSSLLQCLAASRSDVRSCLYRLGFYPTLIAQEKHEKYKSDGKLPYLKLSIGALDDPGFRAIAARYRVEAVTVFVESHDQGWSSYPDDHNTYHNSWTWAELVLCGPDGKPVHRDGPDRLYTNLHGVKRWQNHFKVLGPDSQLVQDLNARIFGPDAATSAAAPPAIGEHQQHPGSDEQQQLLRQAQPKKGVEGVGADALVLLICARFPGWCHSVRQAEVMVHLSPMGTDGSVEVPPRTVEFWEVRHRELMHDY